MHIYTYVYVYIVLVLLCLQTCGSTTLSNGDGDGVTHLVLERASDTYNGALEVLWRSSGKFCYLHLILLAFLPPPSRV